MAATSSINEDAVGEGDEKPFRLLDLPPEIWTKIVKIAVDEEPTLTHLRIMRECRPGMEPHQPPITRTCRIIRHEALLYFYKARLFPKQSFHVLNCELEQVGRLLKMAGRRNRQALGSLYVENFQPDEPDLRWSEFILGMGSVWEDFAFRLECRKTLTIGTFGFEVWEVKFL